MLTKYIKYDNQNPQPELLLAPAEELRRGGLVAFPTETVYGLGANALDPEAVASIYAAKGRPADNPLIVHIADKADLGLLAADISASVQVLTARFWPGPLTIIVNKSPRIPYITTGGLETVAVRQPDSAVACELIRLSCVPVAAPSANISGRPSPTAAKAVLEDLDGKIAYIIDAGPSYIGVESTIIDCTTLVPTLLRPGRITVEMLFEVLGELEINAAISDEAIIARAPGMKYKHYAPKAPILLFEGAAGDILTAMQAKLASLQAEGKKAGCLISAETAGMLRAYSFTVVYGSRSRLEAVATNLYSALRSFDSAAVDIILAEGVSEHGLGLAVMNRLRKAAGYNIVRC